MNRIQIEQGKVNVELSTNAVYQALTGQALPEGIEVNQSLAVTVTAEWQRFGQQVRFVLPPESGLGKPRTQPSLIRAVARAHDWVDRIIRGDVLNQQAIADHTGLDKRYVSQLIQLAFLEPNIVESILDGRQVPHLRLDQCLANVPLHWNP